MPALIGVQVYKRWVNRKSEDQAESLTSYSDGTQMFRGPNDLLLIDGDGVTLTDTEGYEDLHDAHVASKGSEDPDMEDLQVLRWLKRTGESIQRDNEVLTLDENDQVVSTPV